MRRPMLWCCCGAIALTTLLAASAHAAEGAEASRRRVLVLDLAAQGVAPDLAATLTDGLATAVGRDRALDVVSRTDLRALAATEDARQSVGCDPGASNCLAEIANALDAELIVSGSVGLLGDVYVVNVSLFDAKKGQSVAKERVQAVAPADLPAEIELAAARLFGRSTSVAQPLPAVATQQTPAQSTAWLIGVGALGGAVGYGAGVFASVLATGGANPVNAALQHPGEWGLIVTGILVPIPVTGLVAGTVAFLASDWASGLAVAGATAGTALLGHGVLLVAGVAGVRPTEWQVEVLALLVVGALSATAGGATAGLMHFAE